MINLSELPTNLPKPIDDGLAGHLTGMEMPEVILPATNGSNVNTAEFKSGITIIYCYPMTGRPDQELPKDWDNIPGARGCTPQTLSFAEKYKEFEKREVMLFGLSTQDTDYQKEMIERLHVPFPVLSDSEFKLTKFLKLPTFEVENKVLLKRLTMIIRNGIIVKVFYPVFPPNTNAEEVLEFLINS